jgi:hypothetical protein
MAETNNTNEKVYLGDGVYAEFNGSQIVVTTEDDINITNKIYLDSEVTASLINFMDNYY